MDDDAPQQSEADTWPGQGQQGNSTPIPEEADDGTGGEGGELDPSITGDVDPAPETEDHGGEGGLDTVRAGQGAVDGDPELDSTGGGTVDTQLLGVGVIDPLDGESTLLAGDAGDLAELNDQADSLDVDEPLSRIDSFFDSDSDTDVDVSI